MTSNEQAVAEQDDATRNTMSAAMATLANAVIGIEPWPFEVQCDPDQASIRGSTVSGVRIDRHACYAIKIPVWRAGGAFPAGKLLAGFRREMEATASQGPVIAGCPVPMLGPETCSCTVPIAGLLARLACSFSHIDLAYIVSLDCHFGVRDEPCRGKPAHTPFTVHDLGGDA